MNTNDLEIIGQNIKKRLSANALDCALAILGNQASIAKVCMLILKGALGISDTLFYGKLQQFLDGTMLSDDDRAKMRAFLTSVGNTEDNVIRILNCINLVESKKKIEYICNATRCAMNEEIDLLLYFRICNAVNRLMEDDLAFLSEHIGILGDEENNHLVPNYHTQALCTIGAMRVIVKMKHNGDHAFTPFGKILDACTISFSCDDKYPNRKAVIKACLCE